jgi:hypothetical protein
MGTVRVSRPKMGKLESWSTSPFAPQNTSNHLDSKTFVLNQPLGTTNIFTHSICYDHDGSFNSTATTIQRFPLNTGTFPAFEASNVSASNTSKLPVYG